MSASPVDLALGFVVVAFFLVVLLISLYNITDQLSI
jgi:hypothetical protein